MENLSGDDGCRVAPDGVHDVDDHEAAVGRLAADGGLQRALKLVRAEVQLERGSRRCEKENHNITLMCH